jgi:TetR/AcrR family transcriptional regulator
VDTDSAETRRRILLAARKAFSRSGYDATTVKQVAAESGLTAASVYYYFRFKYDLFAEVYRDMQRTILAEFRSAVDQEATLLGRLDALLDATADIQARDPLLADFVSMAPVEIRRHPEIRDAIRDEARALYRLIEGVVKEGAEDLKPNVDPVMVSDVIFALIAGLGQMATGATPKSKFKRTTEGMKLLLRNQFFDRPLPCSTRSAVARKSRR